jgi:hypothetical protein
MSTEKPEQKEGEQELTEEDLDGVSGGIIMPIDLGATKLAPATIAKTVTPLVPLNGTIVPCGVKTTK